MKIKQHSDNFAIFDFIANFQNNVLIRSSNYTLNFKPTASIYKGWSSTQWRILVIKVVATAKKLKAT